MLSTGGHFLPFGASVALDSANSSQLLAASKPLLLLVAKQGIRSGLSILYSNSSSNPTGGHTLIAGKELEFFWECSDADKGLAKTANPSL